MSWISMVRADSSPSPPLTALVLAARARPSAGRPQAGPAPFAALADLAGEPTIERA
ncbi:MULTISPECIES: hypothetical protein [unclassified Streptomyces]|uniref:hypothetical protein n=1 Tax=unclassified Streptomyces TaxID=2593676 RepID=UPI002DD84F2B|nr:MULTISPECIES: hypothetical protein [unclassified Streptomyces]WSC41626.1 hypothetical protein OHA08_42855 [Streptomyces sp. NBC_01763]